MRSMIRNGTKIFLCIGLLGACAGKDKFQDKMRGIWVLKSRTTVDGKEITPPAISGRLEWFPMDVDARTAHVSVLTTHGGGALQVLGSQYDLEDYKNFSQESYLEVGGGISKTPDKSFSVGRKPGSGTIGVDGSKITFAHDNGPTYVFEGARLTIRHADGTQDILLK